MAFKGLEVAAVAGSVALVIERDARTEQDSTLLVRDKGRPVPALEAETPIKEAAKIMAEKGVGAAWVVNQGEFWGIATLVQLLDELSMNRDPLTGIPQSDRLREWGQNRLEKGQEITLLFFDLDSFGRYNKDHGHTFGDRVLKGMVNLVLPQVDKSKDIFVRYGGDEFVLATTRSRQEAERVAERLRGTLLEVEGVPGPVTFSLGVAGGKRTKERTRIHVAATLENLINLASRDALARKPKAPAAATLAEVLARFRSQNPALAPLLADIEYGAGTDGLEVRLMGQQSRFLAAAPLGADAAASVAQALDLWAAAS
jgi:diguanylate cyclase (GGDEF)-like protein